MVESLVHTTEQIVSDSEFEDEFRRIQSKHYSEHKGLESKHDGDREKLKQEHDNEFKQLKDKQYLELGKFASNSLHHRQNRKHSKKQKEFRNEQYQELRRFASNPSHNRQSRKRPRKQELKEFTSNSLGRQNRQNSREQDTKISVPSCSNTYPTPSSSSAEQQDMNLFQTTNQSSNQPNQYSYNNCLITPSGPSKKPTVEQPNQYLSCHNSSETNPNLIKWPFSGFSVNACTFSNLSTYHTPSGPSVEQQDIDLFITANQPSNQPNQYLYNPYLSTPSDPSREPTTEQQRQYLPYHSSSETNPNFEGWLFAGLSTNDCVFGTLHYPRTYLIPSGTSAEQQDINPFSTTNQPSNNTCLSTPSGPSRKPTNEQPSQHLPYHSSSETNPNLERWSFVRFNTNNCTFGITYYLNAT
ncbi:17544_t:CDS:2 [Dentiscutata erythropus]|uniref:17544_t:CDS:1 n=1 Tax=Dentiscutata erythropus TaxID=1348616 RepID=A0A9N9B3Q9_9GLOM|nr:17544_t:CDS:2 [Dentiscutata erythropus]